MVLVTTAAIPVIAEAEEAQWIGIGPRVEIDGQQIYPRVEWTDGHACDIDGPIQLLVSAPRDSKYLVRGESAGRFDCDGDGRYETILMTETRVIERRHTSGISVTASVNSPETRFPVRVSMFGTNEIINVCQGFSNKRIRCRGIAFLGST
jgi:hypothetical protein